MSHVLTHLSSGRGPTTRSSFAAKETKAQRGSAACLAHTAGKGQTGEASPSGPGHPKAPSRGSSHVGVQGATRDRGNQQLPGTCSECPDMVSVTNGSVHGSQLCGDLAPHWIELPDFGGKNTVKQAAQLHLNFR